MNESVLTTLTCFMVSAPNEQRPQKRKIKKVSRHRSRPDDPPESSDLAAQATLGPETRSENQPPRRNADDSRNMERNQSESSTINTTDAPSTEASNDQGDSTSPSFDSNGQSNDEQDGPPAQKARIGEVPEGQGDANDWGDSPSVGTIQKCSRGVPEDLNASQSLQDWDEQSEPHEDSDRQVDAVQTEQQETVCMEQDTQADTNQPLADCELYEERNFQESSSGNQGITNHQNAPGYTDAPPNCFNEEERQCGPPFTTTEGVDQYVQHEWSDHQEVLQTVAQRCDPYDQEPSSSCQPFPTILPGIASPRGPYKQPEFYQELPLPGLVFHAPSRQNQPHSHSVQFGMDPQYNPDHFSTAQNAYYDDGPNFPDQFSSTSTGSSHPKERVHHRKTTPAQNWHEPHAPGQFTGNSNQLLPNLGNCYPNNPGMGYGNDFNFSYQQQYHPNGGFRQDWSNHIGQSMPQQPGGSQRDYYPVAGPVYSEHIMSSPTSATDQKGVGRPTEDQARRKERVAKGRDCLIFFENDLNARNYINASTLLQLVDDCVKKLDDPAGNKEKCPPKMPSRPGAKQKKPAPIIYQPGKLTLEDFRLDPQLLPKYLEERRDVLTFFEIRINNAIRKADAEKSRREALEKLKQKYAAALANFCSDYQGKKDVIIRFIHKLPEVKKFNDEVVLFEKKPEFVRIESVPAGRHCNEAGGSDNKKTWADRNGAEVTFYEDRIKDVIALHDELSNIMKVILPHVQTPADQTAPRQGSSAPRPGYSGHLACAPQVPNQYDPVSPWFESPGRHWEGPS